MEEFIRKSDARRAILKANPASAYCIDNIKPVDAQLAVHAKWLYDSGTGKYFCQACNEYALSFKKDTLYDGDLYEVCLTDYCPHCGACMDQEN